MNTLIINKMDLIHNINVIKNEVNPDDYTIIGSYEDMTTEDYNPDILKIVNTFKDKESINPHAVNPIYLKQTEAEENKKVELI